jgi:hypothetical protein
MVMHQDQRRGAKFRRPFDHFARMALETPVHKDRPCHSGL